MCQLRDPRDRERYTTAKRGGKKTTDAPLDTHSILLLCAARKVFDRPISAGEESRDKDRRGAAWKTGRFSVA